MKSKSIQQNLVPQSEQLSSQVQHTLTKEDIQVLRGSFAKDRLGVKVQSFNKERTRAMLVLYLQHTDVQDRLEQVDPAWTCEVINEERAGDTVYVRSRMTLKGVSRENVGEGGDPKSAYSDALKRCAMLFGVGRYLYDSPTVWTEYNDSRDRFRSWSVEDYESALARTGKSKEFKDASAHADSGQSAPKVEAREEIPAAAMPKPGLTKAAVKPVKVAVANQRPREELNRILMNLYRPYLQKYPETQFSDLLQTRYKVAETRLMTVEQLDDLVQYMETRMEVAA